MDYIARDWYADEQILRASGRRAGAAVVVRIFSIVIFVRRCLRCWLSGWEVWGDQIVGWEWWRILLCRHPARAGC